MQPVAIDDPADPRLDDYVRLTDAQLRRRNEVFLCEGSLVLERAVAAGTHLQSLLVTPERWEQVKGLVEHLDDLTVFLADQAVMNAVTGFDIHRGVIAAATRPRTRTPEELLEGARTVAVLEAINDAENIGAIFRNAAAFGIDAVLLDRRTSDPLYRRSVRVSLGHVLSVPFARYDRLDQVQAAGFTTVALTPHPRADPIETIRDLDKVALLLGAEGPGLDDHTMAMADRRVRIPISSTVDSLNVATAAAIAFHHRAT